ncbi:hypothetical protein J6590_063364 [Homalodisca vitripennis]|nr:hypothetical protein J6590_063364 [Homalodisca vitripennis]
MEPQSISFIGTGDEDQLSSGLNRIQITSGNRTYRIPSPTRSHAPLSKNSFSSPTPPSVRATPEKGFYISFDDDSPPKRPKPPLRIKRNSPKKERVLTQVIEPTMFQQHELQQKSSPPPSPSPPPTQSRLQPATPPRDPPRVPDTDGGPGVGLVIGSELSNPDPVSNVDQFIPVRCVLGICCADIQKWNFSSIRRRLAKAQPVHEQRFIE